MFPLLSESISYDTTNVACLDDVLKFAIMTDCLLFKVMESM